MVKKERLVTLGRRPQGAASEIGANTMSLNNNSDFEIRMNDRTFAHELGQAKFDLVHTDDSLSHQDNVNPPTNSDKTNLMNKAGSQNVIDPQGLK